MQVNDAMEKLVAETQSRVQLQAQLEVVEQDKQDIENAFLDRLDKLAQLIGGDL